MCVMMLAHKTTRAINRYTNVICIYNLVASHRYIVQYDIILYTVMVYQCVYTRTAITTNTTTTNHNNKQNTNTTTTTLLYYYYTYYYYYYINIIVKCSRRRNQFIHYHSVPYARTLMFTVPPLRRRQSWPSRTIKNFKKLVAPSPPPLSVYECRYYLEPVVTRRSPTIPKNPRHAL